MKIKRCPVMFNNVISAKMTAESNQWYEGAQGLRNAIIRNGLYGTGPVIFQTEDEASGSDKKMFTFSIPVNEPVTMEENERYHFEETLLIEDALVLRHADLDEDINESYAILLACAEANDITLQEPFYHIYLDVFGGGLIDICAPILKEDEANAVR